MHSTPDTNELRDTSFVFDSPVSMVILHEPGTYFSVERGNVNHTTYVWDISLPEYTSHLACVEQWITTCVSSQPDWLAPSPFRIKGELLSLQYLTTSQPIAVERRHWLFSNHELIKWSFQYLLWTRGTPTRERISRLCCLWSNGISIGLVKLHMVIEQAGNKT